MASRSDSDPMDPMARALPPGMLTRAMEAPRPPAPPAWFLVLAGAHRQNVAEEQAQALAKAFRVSSYDAVQWLRAHAPRLLKRVTHRERLGEWLAWGRAHGLPLFFIEEESVRCLSAQTVQRVIPQENGLLVLHPRAAAALVLRPQELACVALGRLEWAHRREETTIPNPLAPRLGGKSFWEKSGSVVVDRAVEEVLDLWVPGHRHPLRLRTGETNLEEVFPGEAPGRLDQIRRLARGLRDMDPALLVFDSFAQVDRHAHAVRECLELRKEFDPATGALRQRREWVEDDEPAFDLYSLLCRVQIDSI